MDNLIEIENLSFWYGDNQDSPVLKEINLTVKKGEFIAVVGPNGCGKSTLIRHLNGLLLPNKGRVTVAGLDTRVEGNLADIRRKVGMVFQNPDNQLLASVVEEDVAFGPENLCLPREEIRVRVERSLGQVGMTEYRSYPPQRLSGGQKQKVAIAGVLAMQPECIVLDEPTSMLDSKGKKEVLEAIKSLNHNYGITVIYVTHDMTEVMNCHRLLALKDGEIYYSGKPRDFFANSELVNSVGLHIPQLKELVNALISDGITLPADINTEEELVDALCR